MGWAGRLMTAIGAGVGAFRESLFHPDATGPAQGLDWEAYGERVVRYAIYQAMRGNRAYREPTNRHAAAYKVTMGGVEQRNGLRVTRLEFAEPGRGSLVAHDERSFVRTVVRAWVEVDSGVLQRAEVTLIPPVAAKENHVVRVDYEMNTKLAVRVPVQLTERFWAGGTGEGKATYRNYRRFETGARIVPPR